VKCVLFYEVYISSYSSPPPDKSPQTYNSNTPAAKAGPGNPRTHTKHSSPRTPAGSTLPPRVTAPEKGELLRPPGLQEDELGADIIRPHPVILHRPEHIRRHLEFRLVIVIVPAGLPVGENERAVRLFLDKIHLDRNPDSTDFKMNVLLVPQAFAAGIVWLSLRSSVGRAETRTPRKKTPVFPVGSSRTPAGPLLHSKNLSGSSPLSSLAGSPKTRNQPLSRNLYYNCTIQAGYSQRKPARAANRGRAGVPGKTP
jgi:hypothetical protein